MFRLELFVLSKPAYQLYNPQTDKLLTCTRT